MKISLSFELIFGVYYADILLWIKWKEFLTILFKCG